MRVWGEAVDEFGTCTVMVHPGTVPSLSKLLAPDAPYVYVEDLAPSFGVAGTQWVNLPVPLGEFRVDNLTTRHLSFDALFPTALFIEVAPEVGEVGLYCAQVGRVPPAYPRWRDLDHPAARRNWYEKVDLVVAFELPHHAESAQVTTLNAAHRAAALARFRL